MYMTIKGKNKMITADDRSVKTKAPKETVLKRVYVFAGGHRVEATSYEEALADYKKTLKATK